MSVTVHRIWPIVLIAGLLAGCADDSSVDNFVDNKFVHADQLVRDRYVPEVILHQLPIQTSTDASPHHPAHVVILHTSNERGWFDGGAMGGAAKLAGMWNNLEPRERLTLSSGDSFVGSPVSAWFRGEPTVDVMNAMGYDAMVLGHHELDFGRDQLAAWIADADFSVLAANVEDNGKGPMLADGLYQIFRVGHANVAVIGLSHANTPELAAGPHYEGVTFHPATPYAVIGAIVARYEGADAVVLLTHLDSAEMNQIAYAASEWVDVILGGHGYARSSRIVDGVLVVESGGSWDGYSRVELTVDIDAKQVTDASANFHYGVSRRVLRDPTVKSIIRGWNTSFDMELGGVIAYAANTIERQSWTQANWVTDSWRWAIPEADIAIQNGGGLRADVGPGDITRADIVAMMSFDNSIIQVDLRGAEVIEQLEAALDYCGGCMIPVSGMRYERGNDGVSVQLDDGHAINPKATYTVLVNNFMYYGGSGFLIDGPDREPIFTGMNYRDPVIDWTVTQKSNSRVPLETLIDSAPRNVID